MTETIRRLPDAELEVMQAIWACTPPVARTTLLTVLTRLSEKGFVQIEKTGRSARYTPLVSRQTYLAQQSRRFLHKLCGGSVSALANALCDGGLSKEELAELRELLDRGRL